MVYKREDDLYSAYCEDFVPRFGTKSFFQIWFRIHLTEPFSYRSSFLCFRDTLLYINRTIIVDDEECHLFLFT
jgi:hypothetical protein